MIIDSVFCERCGRYLGGDFEIRYGRFKCKCGHNTVFDYRRTEKPLTNSNKTWYTEENK